MVEKLQYYMDYLGRWRISTIDAYGTTPFKVKVDTSSFQALDLVLKIKLKDPNTFNLSANLPASVTVQNFTTKEKKSIELQAQEFSKDYKFGEAINLPFFSGSFSKNRTTVTTRESILYSIFKF